MSALPDEMNSVVRRWNPSGVDGIAAVLRSSPSGVHVAGPAGAGTSAVWDALGPLPLVDTVADASVVLVVVDASAPLGRAVLEDLRSALESTAVVLALNKIDAYRQWRDVLRADAAAIEEYVPRAVSYALVPTSAKLAARGLIRESGIDVLRDRLRAALDEEPSVVAERKYVAAVYDAAAGARREIIGAARAATAAGATADLRSRRARLTADRDTARHERNILLRSRLQLARTESMHLVSEELRVLAASTRVQLDGESKAGLGQLGTAITSNMRRTAGVVDFAVTAKLEALSQDSGLQADYASPGEVELTLPQLPRRRRGIEDKAAVLVGASAGVGLGRLAVSPLSLVPALDIATIPITLVLGALCAWWLSRSRGLAAERAHLRTWTADVFAHTKSILEQRVLTRMLDAETALGAASASAVASASDALDVELGRVDDQLRAAADTRASLLSACDRDLAALDRGLEHVRFSVTR